jgi:tRNA pseudouridine13 synthase
VSRLPWVTAELPGSGGVLRPDPEDFLVDEVLPYAPSGEGEHLFVRFEKIGLNTPDAVARIVRAAGLGQGRRMPPEVGFAGLKDRHARTRQWMSLPCGASADLPQLESAEGDDLKILETLRHNHKLRRGHQRGNHFEIVLRDMPEGGGARAQAVLERLRSTGVPHAFGPQRFGRDGDNDQVALAFIRGEGRAPRDRRLRDLLLSALQSRIFNRLLAVRIETGLFDKLLLGDLMQKHESGGMFTVENLETEQPRADNLEISPTGPMPGKKMRLANHAAADLEASIIGEMGLSPEEIRKLGPGTRRLLRYPLAPETTLDVQPDSMTLKVFLPSGAYATVLLDEIVKPEDGPFDRVRPAAPPVDD